MVRGGQAMRKQRARPARWMGLAFALLASAPLSAFAISKVRIAHVRTPDIQLSAIEARLQHDAGGAQLHLSIGHAQVGGQQLSDLDWQCRLQGPVDLAECSGPVRWRGGPPGRLRLASADGWRGDWRSGSSRADALMDAAGHSLSLAWQALPMDWLAPWIDESLPEGMSVTAGALSGRGRLDLSGGTWRVDLRLDDAAFDSEDGLTAAAGLILDAGLEGRGLPPAAIDADLRLEAGELLAGQLYVPLLKGSRLQGRAVEVAAGWALEGPLRFSDPEGAQFTLSDAGGGRWALEARLPELSRSGPRYLDGPLAALGFAGSAFAGSLDATVAGNAERIDTLALEAADLTFADAQGVVVLSGLNGPLHWSAEGSAPPTALGWRTLSLQGVALGPAGLSGRVVDGVFEADQALRFAPFGGQLELYPFRVEPLAGSAGFEARMASIDLAALSAQFGWPAFSGELSGTLPAATYRNDLFSSEGELRIGVFGGEVRVGALRWERPFSAAPSIAADIRIDDLDLEPLTGAFGFGAISGRLDGYIRGLRMLAGSPVAFDAFLHTDDDWKGRRRISQKAVNDIGSVGGGVAAGLQQTVLSLFDTFGYRRIGLRCRLANNVCEMGGVEDLGNGYVLIEGAGLPRVTVNGYRRRVDWPVLVARLQAAASGGGISVD